MRRQLIPTIQMMADQLQAGHESVTPMLSLCQLMSF